MRHFVVLGLQAAWAAIQVYLELDRAPASAANAASAQDAADAKLSPEELKKLKQKRRKVHSIQLDAIGMQHMVTHALH